MKRTFEASGWKGSRQAALPVTLRLPNDLPWKPRRQLMMPLPWFAFLRLAFSLASLSAPSFASVPELQKNEYCRSPGVSFASSSLA